MIDHPDPNTVIPLEECICGFKKGFPVQIGDTYTMLGYNGICHACGGSISYKDRLTLVYLGDYEDEELKWHMNKVLSPMYCPTCNRAMYRMFFNCKWLSGKPWMVTTNTKLNIQRNEGRQIMNCWRCGQELEEDDLHNICCICGMVICDRCLRVPDPEIHGEQESLNYCIKCYVEVGGFADVWGVNYITTQGDIANITFDTEPNIHPFKIPGIAKRQVPMWGSLVNWWKEKTVTKEVAKRL